VGWGKARKNKKERCVSFNQWRARPNFAGKPLLSPRGFFQARRKGGLGGIPPRLRPVPRGELENSSIIFFQIRFALIVLSPTN